MILCWPAEILLYRINNALRDASEHAGKGKPLSELHWRARWRIKIWISADWFHLWRWKGWYVKRKYNKMMKNITLEQAENIKRGIKVLNSLRQKD